MSDSKTPEPEFGEPVAEPTTEANVVDRANEALADAQAARDEVASAQDAAEPAPEADVPAADAADSAADNNADAKTYNNADAKTTDPDDGLDWAALDDVMAAEAQATGTTDSAAEAAPADKADDSDIAAETAAAAAAKPAWYDSPEVAESTANLPAEVQGVTEVPLTPPAVADDPVLMGTAPAQPIFVQAPEPPLIRGNRGAAGLIGLLVAIVFAVIYLAARLLFSGINVVDTTALLDETIAQISSFGFWVPVVVFYLTFWLLGAFINRGRWAYWVIFGLFVGLAAYAGHVLGAVIDAHPWQISWNQALGIMADELVAPSAIVALVIGRELPVWFGGWIAKRGRKVTALNNEAQEEYERTLEAGPQLD
ncbi:ABC transporter [Microbacterium sp. YY-03]|uniref:ABC transporter n=1 Tax=Microbacterium sp. YY-03 TaxID=3421636 RepID=UPI003D1766E6